MFQHDAIATVAGRPLARIDKRAADARVYRIDCAPLLRQHELMISAEKVDGSGVIVGHARTRGGRYLEVHLSGGSGKDGRVDATVKTTMGQIGVSFAVRLHA